ncbi:MAG: xanthine dehydrogenase family protein molybdopterin-binding subunit [Actinomycetota bacterium]|nr:xanthine dehydrogenase family protein molybdopterin-binding subunit [Acidimicrobiales bacterium]
MASSGSILGNAVRRKEDPGLLTGFNKYFDDLDVGSVQVVFVRSTMAHAIIESIETIDAEAMPGVLGVYTSKNLEMAAVNGFPMVDPAMDRPPLATDRVRFVGDIIAAVVADTTRQAVDAAEQIIIDYSPLPANADVEAAIAESASVIWEGQSSNVCLETALPEMEIQNSTDPFVGADTVVHERILTQRLAGVPMEPNGCIAIPREGGKLKFFVSTQNAHSVRDALAPNLGMDPEDLHVLAPWVGGGFGPKAGLYVEHIIVAKCALALGRPVKWTEQRGENMVAMGHGRAMVMNAEMGVKNDGTIIGLRARILAETGAYPGIGAFLPVLTQTLSQAVYNIPTIHFQAHSVVTNTTTTVAYRGAGRPEATQMVERILDKAAQAIGMDPAEIRRKNYIQPDQFPMTTITGANYDSGDHEKSLDAVLVASDYSTLRAEQAKRRAANDNKMLGIGLASYVEVTAPLGLHAEYGKCEINADGSATIRVGTSSHGQGHDTAFSMIVEDMLGIPSADVTHIDADTEEVKQGAGTMGSRSLQTAGSAIYEASKVVLEKGKQLAANMLEASADDIVVGEGALQVAGVPAKSVSWAELAAAVNDDSVRPSDMDGGLDHELVFDEGDSTFPFGSHVAVVEVDRETGEVELLRHIAVDDCGTILNPMLVTGQQHGGIAQGIAQALWEQVQYDEDANPVTANLMDYLMPSAADLPSFETSNTETASPRNPLGAKGIGESGTIGSTPAAHNAVCDALSHLGIEHIDMPCTPQAVWTALQAV